MTTTISVSSSNCIGRCSTEAVKPLSRVERTKSFLKASLIKKWKSSKELFTKPLNHLTGNDNKEKPPKKQNETHHQNGKIINEKLLDNLDDFERNFLLSAGRKILVRELRKNFEKPQQYTHSSNASGSVVITVNGSSKPKTTNMPIDDKPKKFVNASVQTIPNYEEISYETKAITNNQNPKKNAIVMRHSSFYNTYRNEYCPWQDNHYASNLSLASHGIPSNSERCLEKTINKYKNSIKSSSAVDLSSFSAIVLNTTIPTTRESSVKSSSMQKQHYSSIVNISHSNSSQNLTGSPIIDYRYDPLNTTSPTYAVIEKAKQKNSQLKATHSIKSLNIVSSAVRDGINNTNMNICFHNGDYDTKSLIVSSASSVLCDNAQNNDNTACHFNRYISKTNLYGSNLTLNDTSTNNNINNNNNYEYGSSLNCHNKNINNKTNTSNNCHDGNNNNTSTKIRKCYSINQIDLNLLKNELDEYIDRELRTTNFGQNTLAQRRYLFENDLKKVNNFFYFALNDIDLDNHVFLLIFELLTLA